MSENDGKFKLTIVTPFSKVYEGFVDMVVVNAIDGSIGIMKGHVPMIAALKPGISHIKNGDKTVYFVLSDGYVEINDESCLIICNYAVSPEDLSASKTIEEYKEVKKYILKNKDITVKELVISEQYVMAKLRAIEKFGSEKRKEIVRKFLNEIDES